MVIQWPKAFQIDLLLQSQDVIRQANNALLRTRSPSMTHRCSQNPKTFDETMTQRDKCSKSGSSPHKGSWLHQPQSSGNRINLSLVEIGSTPTIHFDQQTASFQAKTNLCAFFINLLLPCPYRPPFPPYWSNIIQEECPCLAHTTS